MDHFNNKTKTMLERSTVRRSHYIKIALWNVKTEAVWEQFPQTFLKWSTEFSVNITEEASSFIQSLWQGNHNGHGVCTKYAKSRV